MGNNKNIKLSNGLAKFFDCTGRLCYALSHAKTSIFDTKTTVYKKMMEMMGTIIWSADNIYDLQEQTFVVDIDKYQKLEMYVLDQVSSDDSISSLQSCITFIPGYSVQICSNITIDTYVREVECVSTDESSNICTYKIHHTTGNTTNVPICIIGYPMNIVTN